MKVRIKGTKIYVKCLGIGVSNYETKGIECEYLTGKYKGKTEVIPGDCLVEEEDKQSVCGSHNDHEYV